MKVLLKVLPIPLVAVVLLVAASVQLIQLVFVSLIVGRKKLVLWLLFLYCGAVEAEVWVLVRPLYWMGVRHYFACLALEKEIHSSEKRIICVLLAWHLF